jgi:chromosome segregation ATPase
VKLEVEELQKEIENYVEQLKTVDDTIQQYEEQIQELLDKMKLTKVFIEKKNVLRYNEQNYEKKVIGDERVNKDQHTKFKSHRYFNLNPFSANIDKNNF